MFWFMFFVLLSSLGIYISGCAYQPHLQLEDSQELFAVNAAKLIDHIIAQGYHVTVGEAFRTQEQSLIYAREGKGIVNSLHRQRLAIDLNIFTPDNKLVYSVADLMQFGVFWESLNPRNVWGGRWKHADSDHFQMEPE